MLTEQDVAEARALVGECKPNRMTLITEYRVMIQSLRDTLTRSLDANEADAETIVDLREEVERLQGR